MKYTYYPQDVCSKEFHFEIKNGRVIKFEIVGGCRGNTLGICRLLKGMKIEEVIKKLDKTPCFNQATKQPRKSSCPAQIAKALKEIQKKK